MKEREKVFEWDVTLTFKVSAQNEDKAIEIIEEELEFINHEYITEEIWFKKSKEV